jgi:hypothetical protein
MPDKTNDSGYVRLKNRTLRVLSPDSLLSKAAAVPSVNARGMVFIAYSVLCKVGLNWARGVRLVCSDFHART